MTNLEAACYLKELAAYAANGSLPVPRNADPDTAWACALDRGIRALLAMDGLDPETAMFQDRPDGSFAALGQPAPVAGWLNVLVKTSLPGTDYTFEFRLRVRGGTPNEIKTVLGHAAKNKIPDDIPGLLDAACRSRGWDFTILGRNAAGFPPDVIV